MQKDNKFDLMEEAVFLSKLIDEANIKWAFAGGIAVGIHGYVRATEDIDIILERRDLDKLDSLLKDQGYIIPNDSIDFKDGFKLFRRVKIVDNDYFILDILVAPKEFSNLLDNRIEGLLDGVKIYVITKQDLIRLKKQTGRKIDQADVEELEKNDEK